MLSSKPSLENPVTGERIKFRTGPAVAEGEPLVFDYYLQPGGFAVGKVDHVHPVQTERFDVQAGRLGVRIDGHEWTATAGTRFAIPPETPHTVWNDGDKEMHAVVEITPALSIAAFFETTFDLAREGRTNGWGLPNPLHLAVIAWAFREELYLAALPRRLQLATVPVLAALGRLAGYRATPPRRQAGVVSEP